MKAIMAVLASLFLAQAFADAPAPPAAPAAPASPHKSNTSVHRYLVERTFPRGALDGLDAATKQKVNANNSSVGVRWIESYATADKTKTYCIYEGPNEAAVRKAATLNALPVDSIVEVPVTLLPN